MRAIGDALERRAEELRAEFPDGVYRPAGTASELDDIGHLGFLHGPADQPPMASGMDIARTKDGVIIELYTIITETRQPSSLDPEVGADCEDDGRLNKSPYRARLALRHRRGVNAD